MTQEQSKTKQFTDIDIVLWKNTKNSRRPASFGFNFQPKNKFKEGDIFENCFSGHSDWETEGYTAEVMGIL